MTQIITLPTEVNDLAAKAPIKKQLSLWVDSFELPAFATENKTCEEIFDKFEAFKVWAKKQVEAI